MRDWAFALAISSGFLILVGSVLASLMAASGMMGFSSGMMGTGGMMGMGGMMGFSGTWYSSWFFVTGITGLFAGVGILAAASYLRRHPRASLKLGVMFLILSALSFFSGGGFLIGGTLGVLAGTLTIVTAADSDTSSPQGAQN